MKYYVDPLLKKLAFIVGDLPEEVPLLSHHLIRFSKRPGSAIAANTGREMLIRFLEQVAEDFEKRAVDIEWLADVVPLEAQAAAWDAVLVIRYPSAEVFRQVYADYSCRKAYLELYENAVEKSRMQLLLVPHSLKRGCKGSLRSV